MPDLGKATYELIFDTREGEAAVAGMEARADVAGKNISASMGMAEKSVTDVGVSAQAAAGQVAAAGGEMAGGMGEAGAAADAMATQVGAANAAAATSSTAAAGKVGTAWAAAGRSMEKIGRRMRSVGRGMMHKITLPALLIGGYAVKSALDYTEQIRMIETQAGGTAKEVSFMNNAILKLARSGQVTHTPNALAKALFHLESSGIRGRKAIEALTQADHLATVGHADLEASTDAVAHAFSSGIIGAGSFSHAVGVVNATVGAGNMRLVDFNSAMGTGIYQSAVSAGVSLQEVGAALATFTTSGLPAVNSMTALRMSLSMLQKPTTKQVTAMKQMGYSQLELAKDIRTKGLVPTIEDLRVRYEKLIKAFGKERANQILLEAFGGSKSGKAMLGLIQNTDKLRHAYDQINAKTKDFKSLTATALNEPVNKMRANLAKMSAALIGIGNKLVPIVTKIVNGLARMFHWFSKLSPRAQKFILIGIGIAAALGPVLSIIGGLITVLPVLYGGLMAFGGIPLIIIGVAVAAFFLWRRFKAVRMIVAQAIHEIRALTGWLLRQHTVVKILAGVLGLLAFRMLAIRAAGLAARFGMIAMLGPMGLLVTAAMGVAAAFLYMRASIQSAQDQADEAWSHVGTTRGAGLTFYAHRVAAYEKTGMNPDKARRRARADTLKHLGPEALPSKPGIAGNPPRPKHATRPPRMPKMPKYTTPDLGSGGYTPNPSAAHEGGGGGGGGGKGNVLGSTYTGLEDNYLRARHTKGLKDDAAALHAEESFLTRLLRQRGLSEKKRHAALTALNAVDSKLHSLGKKAGAGRGHSHGNTQYGAFMDRIDIIEAKIATEKHKKAREKLLRQETQMLNNEESYLQKKLKAKNLSLKEQGKIAREIKAIERKKLELARKSKQASNAFGKEYEAVLETRGTFFSDFAGSIFGQSSGGLTVGGTHGGNDVSVNQTNHYNEIPKNRYAHARAMQRAAAEAMGGV